MNHALILVLGFITLLYVGYQSSRALRSLVETQVLLSGANAQSNGARAKAEAASGAKSCFLATMSHELRTPLNVVIGASQLPKSKGNSTEIQLVDSIERSGVNLLDLSDSILDMARIEAGDLQLATADFDLVDSIEPALATAALAARAKGLALACVIESELPAWRHGDAARLGQMMLNLLGNAVKFTPHGEMVVRVARGTREHDLCISIRDTGVGVGTAELPHIFELLRQADEGPTRRSVKADATLYQSPSLVAPVDDKSIRAPSASPVCG